jgi:hypothetical protein
MLLESLTEQMVGTSAFSAQQKTKPKKGLCVNWMKRPSIMKAIIPSLDD